MTLKEQLEQANRIIVKDAEIISDLRHKLGEQKETIRHYEVAVSAVKWLWDQASKQTPFQI